MTLRERIADWISGGAVIRGMIAQSRAEAFEIRRDELRERLYRIAAEETPKANATVKRMAAIARGER